MVDLFISFEHLGEQRQAQFNSVQIVNTLNVHAFEEILGNLGNF